MRWPFRKKPIPKPVRSRIRPGASVFHCVIQLGDTDSRQTVSSELLERLIQATKQPALGALDRHFGTESWCSEISTHASLEGPAIYFNLDLAVQPGETVASMSELVDGEFRRRWNAAIQRLLT